MISGVVSCHTKKPIFYKGHLWPRPPLEEVNCQAKTRCEGEALKRYDRNFLKILEDNGQLRSAPVWENPEELSENDDEDDEEEEDFIEVHDPVEVAQQLSPFASL